MYPRWAYVGLLAASVGSIQMAAAFGEPWQVSAAYATVLALGVVVFYQSEARVTNGPVVASIVLSLFAGTAASLIVAAGLLAYVLGAPPDFALWQVAILMFDTWLGVAFAFVGAFFSVGLVSAYA